MHLIKVSLFRALFDFRPTKIVATGHLNSEGTDDTVSVAMTYSNGRTATFSTHSRVDLPCEGHAYGTKGEAILHFPFWSSQKLTVLDQKYEWQLPKSKRPMVFWNSEGLAYQAQHVRDCLAKGLTESPIVCHAETMLVAEIMEDVRKQVGVKYPQDN
jgi:dihydrodiol dehydrogenase / D-xylose 1-dehydrogenase (NADP)